jgi:hypothetical protein
MSGSNDPATVVSERPDSVKISVSKAGDISYEIKIYAGKGRDAAKEAQELKAEMDSWIEAEKNRAA